jgi:transposase
MSNILYIGLDVDDKAFHGAIYSKQTQEMLDFKTKPTFGGLLKQLKKIKKNNENVKSIKICYEASYIGFDLCRKLIKNKFGCEVIAPSLIPELKGKQTKTDKLDSRKLAKYYANDLLTIVDIPDEQREKERALIRTRDFLVKQRKNIKKHILSNCRIYGMDFKKETTRKNYWTKVHITWLRSRINDLEESLKLLFECLMREIELTGITIDQLEDKIEELSKTDKYKGDHDKLVCFRGISTLSAMTIITEIGPIKRFKHPKNLTSYAGLDLREYSSGGNERRYGITKAGNKRLRTILIECCQTIYPYKTLNKRLKKVRTGIDLKVINIAEKCGERLRKKQTKMRIIGKHVNKIKVACARELLCFVWEMLYKTA